MSVKNHWWWVRFLMFVPRYIFARLYGTFMHRICFYDTYSPLNRIAQNIRYVPKQLKCSKTSIKQEMMNTHNNNNKKRYSDCDRNSSIDDFYALYFIRLSIFAPKEPTKKTFTPNIHKKYRTRWREKCVTMSHWKVINHRFSWSAARLSEYSLSFTKTRWSRKETRKKNNRPGNEKREDRKFVWKSGQIRFQA